MNCYGKESREMLVRKYEIHPIAHVKLLAGQEKLSCTGRLLTDSYYCFQYKKRDDDKKFGTFFCGLPTAKHFLELTDNSELAQFNPLRSESNSSTTKSNSSPTLNDNRRPINPTTKELLDAINLLVVVWNTIPYGRLARIKEAKNKYYYRPPFKDEISYVNKVISYDKEKRTLAKMLEELSQSNNLKHFDFSLLNKVLDDLGETSYFGTLKCTSSDLS
ncbi:hypothetical protein M988_2273 [Hafnia paralvei ATCC 29927]|uniref:hypothetical protein n=1 Tax=Hafnia paralvei TaxID=546367 RepID=UPI0007E2E251|nr:hypothetical protein [Hafnia paralvei]OAT41096.1 hypothetical protein M988_2273 [Hafnia paralvei ATCC 29927]